MDESNNRRGLMQFFCLPRKPEAVEEMQRPSQVTISQGSSIEEEEEDVKGPIQQVNIPLSSFIQYTL